jgi:hypothetical protein
VNFASWELALLLPIIGDRTYTSQFLKCNCTYNLRGRPDAKSGDQIEGAKEHYCVCIACKYCCTFRCRFFAVSSWSLSMLPAFSLSKHLNPFSCGKLTLYNLSQILKFGPQLLSSNCSEGLCLLSIASLIKLAMTTAKSRPSLFLSQHHT